MQKGYEVGNQILIDGKIGMLLVYKYTCAIYYYVDEQNTFSISRYMSGDQSEVDESIELIFCPINVIENWSFEDEIDLKMSSGDIMVEKGDKSDQSWKTIYDEMTGHCQGGLRLLYLHIKESTKRGFLVQ